MSLNNKLLYGGMYIGSFGLGLAGEMIIPGHGRDVAYCFHSYAGVQFFNLDFSPGKSAAVAFTVQSVGEVCQHYGLFSGTFDWKDFIAYAVGSTLVFGTEKLIRSLKKNNQSELSDLVDK